MITCPNCSFENADGTQICTRCGFLLVEPSSTRIIQDAEREERQAPKYGSVRFKNNLVVEIIEGADEKAEFVFDRDEVTELVMGRHDPDTDESPPIDLEDYGGVEMGVSRNHAKILRREGALHIMDNHSANGTFLNGQRLVAEQLRVLRDGDDIRLGKIVLRVTFA
ncbi:MAG: FHA domain-containing protein [Chloroflexota bacterium]